MTNGISTECILTVVWSGKRDETFVKSFCVSSMLWNLLVHKKVCVVWFFLIQILLLQYASEIQSPQMFFLLLLRFNNIVSLNCCIQSQQHCSIVSSICQTWVMPLNRAFNSQWFSSLALTGVRPRIFRHFALYRQSREIQECLTNVLHYLLHQNWHIVDK